MFFFTYSLGNRLKMYILILSNQITFNAVLSNANSLVLSFPFCINIVFLNQFYVVQI